MKQRLTDDEIEEFRRVRKLAGQALDPETAEVTWKWVEVRDPYDIERDLRIHQIGREFFARGPGSEAWVWFGDLPGETLQRLYEKHRGWLPFPRADPTATPAERLPIPP